MLLGSECLEAEKISVRPKVCERTEVAGPPVEILRFKSRGAPDGVAEVSCIVLDGPPLIEIPLSFSVELDRASTSACRQGGLPNERGKSVRRRSDRVAVVSPE